MNRDADVGGTSAGLDRTPVNDGWTTGRTESFSDGVFAIAITLLVLDLRVPASAFHNLWAGIAHQWPSYLAYATSFITIGAIWLAHHGLFHRLHVVNRTVMRLNLLLLMTVSFLPFPTKLIAQAIESTDALRPAVIFYGGTLLVISLLISALWRSAAGARELLKQDVSEREIDTLLRASGPNVGLYVSAIALAIVFPREGAFAYLLVAIILLLRARGDQVVPSRTGGSDGTRRDDAS
jgi:uncharacterized membrane protein